MTLEDFHGTAEAIVFPDAWARLNQVVAVDAAMLLSGGHSARDRGEDAAPFIVESARPLADLEASGLLGVAIRWAAPRAPDTDAARAAARVCEPTPVPPRSILTGPTATAPRCGCAPAACGWNPATTRFAPSASCSAATPSPTMRAE